MLSKPIRNLKNNINKTKLTIESFLTCLASTEALASWLIKPDRNPFEKNKTGSLIKRHIDHAKASQDDLYEMGFIKIFADFESFMYGFLVELYTKYPKSIENTSKLDFESLMNSKNIKELRKSFIDETAASDSWTLEGWEEKLKNKFKIIIFKDNKEREFFLILNEIRNAIMHSNGRANTKILKKLKALNAPDLKHGQKVPLKNEKLFLGAYKQILIIIRNIENGLKSTNESSTSAKI